jgi:hypothetical protein
MKKFLLLWLVTLYASVTHIQAQTCSGGPNSCTITASAISSSATAQQQVGPNCVTTFNLQFDLLHNGGMKYLNLYFFDGGLPSGVCGNTPGVSTPNLGGYIALAYNGSVFTPQTSGIGGLTPQTGYTVSWTPITGGSRITITGATFTKSGTCGSSSPQITFYLGATNASSNGIQCYNTYSFTPYTLSISGLVNCSSSTRTYNIAISSNYQNPPGTFASVSGTFSAWVDMDNSGTVNTGDIQITNGSSFSTMVTLSGSSYGQSNIPYSITLSNGDIASSRNVIVVVTPSTPGVAAASRVLTNTCGTLPVTFVNFNASRQQGRVLLTWETGSESNNRGFEVQRRVNGNAFETIGFVPSRVDAGTGGGASYSFEDRSNLPNGSIHYRLRQVDFDGKAMFSDVRLIRVNATGLVVSIYPNPSRGVANVIFPDNAGLLDISLEDFSGKQLQRWNAYSNKTLQLNNLKPGMYVLRMQVRDTGEQLVERIMVQ